MGAISDIGPERARSSSTLKVDSPADADCVAGRSAARCALISQILVMSATEDIRRSNCCCEEWLAGRFVRWAERLPRLALDSMMTERAGRWRTGARFAAMPGGLR